MVYFITETVPFAQTLHERALTQKDQLEQVSKAFGLRVEDLLVLNLRRTPQEPYKVIENIPSEFWSHACFVKLPAKSTYRKNLCVKIVDGHHRKRCTRIEEFHLESKDNCICKHCGRQLEWFHECLTND